MESGTISLEKKLKLEFLKVNSLRRIEFECLKTCK